MTDGPAGQLVSVAQRVDWRQVWRYGRWLLVFLLGLAAGQCRRLGPPSELWEVVAEQPAGWPERGARAVLTRRNPYVANDQVYLQLALAASLSGDHDDILRWQREQTLITWPAGMEVIVEEWPTRSIAAVVPAAGGTRKFVYAAYLAAVR